MRSEIGDPNNGVHDLDAQDLGPVSALLLRTNACVPCSIEIKVARDFQLLAMDVASQSMSPTRLRSASSPNIECGFGDLITLSCQWKLIAPAKQRSALEPGMVHELVIALDLVAVPRERTLAPVATRSHLHKTYFRPYITRL